MNRQDACSTREFVFCETGILPVVESGIVSGCIGIISNQPKLGDGSAVSLQFIVVGTRHCRVLSSIICLK